MLPDRFDIVVPLHEISGWRRALAVDRGGVAPRAVVISYPPPAITDDPTRLVGLMRDAEAAALVHHPNAVPALGLETAGDLLVAVEAYRRGVSLRALLRVARRLPPELAARVAVDACAALAAVHAVDPGDGHPLAHGGISADRLLVADDGATLLCGTGTAGGGAQADDLKAVGAVLQECLLGDPSSPPAEHAGASEIPAQLLEVVRRAIGDAPEGAYTDAEALAAAVREAIRPAPPEAMAAYLEAILPAGEGERGELLRLVASALSRAAASVPPAREAAAAPAQAASAAGTSSAASVTEAPSPAGQVASEPVAGAGPALPSARDADAGSRPAVAEAAAVPGGTPAAAPAASPAIILPPEASAAAAAAPSTGSTARAPVVVQDPVSNAPRDEALSAASPPAAIAPSPSTSPGPQGVRPGVDRSRLVLAVAVAMAIVGFGGGLVVARSGRAPAPSPSAGPAAPTSAAGATPAAPAAPAPETHPVPPAPEAPGADVAAPAREAHASPPSAQAGPAAVASAPSIAVTAEPPGEVYVDGKRIGRSPVTVPVSRGDHDVRLKSTYEGVDVRRRVTVRRAGTPVRFALRRGSLKVTAPQDAEVFVDGKRVGRGDVNVALWEGAHVVEARLGQARVHEKFTLGPGETWTYDVTPTP